jgi:hypothetical protein
VEGQRRRRPSADVEEVMPYDPSPRWDYMTGGHTAGGQQDCVVSECGRRNS